MGEHSKISWTDATFNPWWGCTNVSPGCDHCYAEIFAKRTGHHVWGKDGQRRFFGDKHWKEPLKWNAKAGDEGKRLKVFCASMCDILEEWCPSPGEENRMDAERTQLWELIETTANLDWLLLTKRPQNFAKMLPATWLAAPRPNAWIMTTVESPDYLWRLDAISRVPAVVHGVSWEPGLSYVDITDYSAVENLWLIAGGESCVGCRPFNLDAARSMRNDCRMIGASFFMKQLGGHPDKRDRIEEWPHDLRVQEFPRVSGPSPIQGPEK